MRGQGTGTVGEEESALDALCRLAGPRGAVLVEGEAKEARARIVRRDDLERELDPRAALAARLGLAEICPTQALTEAP